MRRPFKGERILELVGENTHSRPCPGPMQSIAITTPVQQRQVEPTLELQPAHSMSTKATACLQRGTSPCHWFPSISLNDPEINRIVEIEKVTSRDIPIWRIVP